MEFTEVVLKRRMVRHFTEEPVAPEVVHRLLDLALHGVRRDPVPQAGTSRRHQ